MSLPKLNESQKSLVAEMQKVAKEGGVYEFDFFANSRFTGVQFGPTQVKATEGDLLVLEAEHIVTLRRNELGAVGGIMRETQD